MPIIEYKCIRGHVVERILSVAQAQRPDSEYAICTRTGCTCIGKRVAASHTGAPILKPGNGGFYKPTQ